MSSSFRTGLVVLGVVFALGLVIVAVQGDPRLPLYDQGYEPEQPVAFSHRLHAGELGIGCLHCHAGADASRHAGVPPMQTCFNCHRFISATQNARRREEAAAESESRPVARVVSPEIRKIYRSLGLDDDLNRDSSLTPAPIRWVRVHNVPDFAFFDHARHVNGGIECAACHGAVEAMERVRQEKDLSMGFCVNCHRAENEKNRAESGSSARLRDRARIDCDACHY